MITNAFAISAANPNINSNAVPNVNGNCNAHGYVFVYANTFTLAANAAGGFLLALFTVFNMCAIKRTRRIQ